MQPLLEVTDFAVHRRNGFAVRLPALKLLPGKVAALYGPSGCGKTAILLSLLNLLDDVTKSGRVMLCGREVSCLQGTKLRHMLRHEVIYLAQDAHAALDPLQRVGRQIEQATAAAPPDVGDALERLGVESGIVDRLPHQISGGQAQRVQLAMAFLRRPALVLADEPSANLDGGSYAELLGQLRSLLAADSSVLLATHDERLLRDLDATVHVAVDGSFEPDRIDVSPWPVQSTGVEVGDVPLLRASGLRVAFGDRLVLDDVDFAIARGEIVGVVGESGAGKSTLARVLAAHCQPDAGVIERPERIGAVQLCCQDALGSMTPGRTLASMVEEAKTPFFDTEAACRQLRIGARVLGQSGVGMSGGERRRAVLLRALAAHPDVLLLDEPTASLDRETSIAVLRSLLDLQRSRSLAMVLITHDLELARSIAHRVVTVAGGRLEAC